MELHVSVAVDERRRYKVRGLSVRPTRVIRFLERLRIHYNPSRPAPLETTLASGDRIGMGDGNRSPRRFPRISLRIPTRFLFGVFHT